MQKQAHPSPDCREQCILNSKTAEPDNVNSEKIVHCQTCNKRWVKHAGKNSKR